MHSIHAPPVIGIGETKETRRRSAGSVAEVWALEELDERTIANALIDTGLVLGSRLMCTYPVVNRGLSGPTDRAGRDCPHLAIRLPDMGHPATAALEEFDGDLFALDVGQHVRTEHNRKGFCLR
jgi:hypothetical protein